MRFSRSNLTSSVNHLDQEGLSTEQVSYEPQQVAPLVAPPQEQAAQRSRAKTYHPDATAADAIEGRAELPVWQRSFLMGPNVRFTRTPHVVDAERRNPSQKNEAAADESQAEDIRSDDISLASDSHDVKAAVSVQAQQERPIAKPMYIPQPPGATGARALSYRLRRELALQEQQRLEADKMAAEIPAASVSLGLLMDAAQTTLIESSLAVESNPQFTPVQQPAAQVSEPAAAIAEPLNELASVLPDHLFWELVDVAPEQGSFVETVTEGALAPIVAASPEAPATAILAPSVPAVVAPVVKAKVAHVAYSASDDEQSAISHYRSIGVRQPSQISLAMRGAVEAPEPTEPSAISASVDTAAVTAQAETHIQAPIRRIQPRAHNPLFIDAPSLGEGEYELPPIELLQQAPKQIATTMTPESLEQSAGLLESILEDFGVKGEIIDVRPGPVVTLYEFEPAPGVKSSRVIGLSDDIARSMSALSARVAVVPGRNVIGIELPNPVRETVYFRELIESPDYDETRMKLALCLGKTIGGEPVVAELAKMPHLLVAGTTGSGKSVAINTMILSLLYRLKPEECRLIMVDPKMLELSVYDGIPHLLTPVVTDPKKAVMALKWAVREMEDRYKKMSRLGVRNIDGYNARAATAREKGETVYSTVQTGFDRTTGEPIYEQEEMDLTAMPYIVVIVDEMADLMMVAGKEIEGAIQRLAQMARAAGIHLIMATQRPSVDVITGTIKANFPTRISFQVTSKIDSRTILGEQGAEHLLGQGDMLHMMGGGRISRVHGPFVSDEEVEKVVAHLKAQGRPEYLGTVTEEADEAEADDAEDAAVFDKTAMGEDDSSDLYEKAVKVVMRDKKCSTSYIQRRLSIGYNRAASLVERMEQDGIVGPANHVGKRAIIAGERSAPEAGPSFD